MIDKENLNVTSAKSGVDTREVIGENRAPDFVGPADLARPLS